MARTIVGTVVSDKADKTIVLSVTVRKTHPLYKKQYSRSTKYIAHDENNEAHTGDKVEVEETRPISKRKSLKLIKVIDKAEIAADLTVDKITAADEGSEAKIQETKVKEAAAAQEEANESEGDES